MEQIQLKNCGNHVSFQKWATIDKNSTVLKVIAITIGIVSVSALIVLNPLLFFTAYLSYEVYCVARELDRFENSWARKMWKQTFLADPNEKEWRRRYSSLHLF